MLIARLKKWHVSYMLDKCKRKYKIELQKLQYLGGILMGFYLIKNQQSNKTCILEIPYFNFQKKEISKKELKEILQRQLQKQRFLRKSEKDYITLLIQEIHFAQWKFEVKLKSIIQEKILHPNIDIGREYFFEIVEKNRGITKSIKFSEKELEEKDIRDRIKNVLEVPLEKCHELVQEQIEKIYTNKDLYSVPVKIILYEYFDDDD